MAKEFFKDLPNTTTPLTASRLNGLLDGEEALGNIVVDSIRSKNMFSGFLLGAYNTTTGIFDPTNTSVYASQKIPVKQGQKYCISGFEPYVYVRFFYWNGSTFVSTELMTTTSDPIIITAQGNFMAFQTGTSSVFSNLQVELGETATTYAQYQELNNMETYSTEEQVIGTFLGKPLYRKVVKYSSSISAGWSGVAFSTLGISNIEYLRIPSALGKSSNQYEEMVSNQNRIIINIGNSTLSLYLTDGSFSEITFILEYTKTTD